MEGEKRVPKPLTPGFLDFLWSRSSSPDAWLTVATSSPNAVTPQETLTQESQASGAAEIPPDSDAETPGSDGRASTFDFCGRSGDSTETDQDSTTYSSNDMTPLETAADDSPLFVVVHAVDCLGNLELYQDAPEPVVSDGWGHSTRHLEGRTPIHSMETLTMSYLGLAFIAVRRHICHHKLSAPAGPVYEGVQPVSEQLRADFAAITSYNWDTNYPIDHDASPLPGKQSPAYVNLYNQLDLEEVYSKKFLYHHREALRELANHPGEKRDDIESLLAYLAEEATFSEQFALCDQQFSSGEVSCETMDCLFRPGETLVVPSVDSAGEIDHSGVVLGHLSSHYDSREYRLVCWHWDFDSVQLCRQEKLFTIDLPRGAMAMADLPAYPLRYAPDAMRTKLESRGQKFWNLRYPTQVTYQGWDASRLSNHAAGSRFMIDYHAYRVFDKCRDAFDPNPAGRSPKVEDPYDDYPRSVPITQGYLDPGIAIHLPAVIYGYPLEEGDHDWVPLKLSKIQITWPDEVAWDRLYLPEPTKLTLRSLVLGRTAELQQRQDGPSSAHGDIAGPSRLNGPSQSSGPMVIHIDGPHGTGKTATASALADLAAVPLVSVDPSRLQYGAKRLNAFLRRAGHAWNAILLLDRIDSLIMTPRGIDAPRSLTKGLLHWYPGVVVLTTSRGGRMDPVVESCISFSATYPPLGWDEQVETWQDGLRKISDQFGTDSVEPALWEVDPSALSGDRDLSGREIHIVLDVAMTLARGEGSASLESHHIRTAVEGLPQPSS